MSECWWTFIEHFLYPRHYDIQRQKDTGPNKGPSHHANHHPMAGMRGTRGTSGLGCSAHSPSPENTNRVKRGQRNQGDSHLQQFKRASERCRPSRWSFYIQISPKQALMFPSSGLLILNHCMWPIRKGNGTVVGKAQIQNQHPPPRLPMSPSSTAP